MKTLCTIILTVVFLWSSSLSAEYCKFDDTGRVRSCEFKISGLKKDSQIIISYTQTGWSLMAVVFVKEFVFVEGDASIKIGKSELQTMEYVTTRRDIVYGAGMMEAAVFRVSEELLHKLANSDGTVRLYLPAAESKDREIKATASKFSKLDEYIAETKLALGL